VDQSTTLSKVGFEVLTAVGTKMAVFWVIAPCSLEEVNFYQTTRRCNPEDSHVTTLSNYQSYVTSNDRLLCEQRAAELQGSRCEVF
jgi:hypothetical protein